MTPISLGIFASANTTVNTSFDSIATTAISTAQAGVTFSSIPSTYTHLQIRYIMRANTDTNTRMRMQFNGTTSSNYSIHILEGASSVVASFSGASTASMLGSAITRSSYLANTFVGGVIDVLDYTDANKNKTARMLSGQDLNGDANGMINLTSGAYYLNTNAISSITLFLDSSIAFAPNSHFALYGIKGVA